MTHRFNKGDKVRIGNGTFNCKIADVRQNEDCNDWEYLLDYSDGEDEDDWQPESRLSLAPPSPNTLPKPIAFTLGDMVNVNSSRYQMDNVVVHTVSTAAGSLQYAVGGVAWFDHADLELVARATPQTLAAAIRLESDDDEELEGEPE